MEKILVNFDEPFMAVAKQLYADKQASWQNGDENWEIVYFDESTNFSWQQRIFSAGMILHLIGSNIRIFIEEKLI